MIPGEVRTLEGDIELNAGRETRTVTVTNSGDRPIQVGSHFHAADVNAALSFGAAGSGPPRQLEREEMTGFRFDIAAGTSLRFEPGLPSPPVGLVALAGTRRVPGLQIRS